MTQANVTNVIRFDRFVVVSKQDDFLFRLKVKKFVLPYLQVTYVHRRRSEPRATRTSHPTRFAVVSMSPASFSNNSNNKTPS